MNTPRGNPPRGFTRLPPWVTPNLLIARSGFTSPIRFWRAIEGRASVFMMHYSYETQVLLRPLGGLLRAFLAMLHNWNFGRANRRSPIRHPKSSFGIPLVRPILALLPHPLLSGFASPSPCLDPYFRSPRCTTDANRLTYTTLAACILNGLRPLRK